MFPELKTTRLVLRKLEPTDWKMVSFLRSDSTVNQFVKRPAAPTKEKALAFISKIQGLVSKKTVYYWCISEISNPEMLGSICLWNFSTDKKTAEIGYDLNPKFYKKGIMTEAMKAILEFGFKHLNLSKIEAYTHANNTSSTNLLKRHGFILNLEKLDVTNKDNLIYEKVAPKY